MRESFGGAFMIKLILIFIVIYMSFMAVAINYAKVFRVKNNVINILEQNQFLMNEAPYTANIIEKIDDDYLAHVPYNEYNNESIKSDCGSNYGSGSVIEFGNELLNIDAKGRALAKSTMLTERGVCITRLGDVDNVYYKVTAYISIEFPFFGLYFTVPVSGETKIISN